MLAIDHYKAQKTPSVLTMLKDECNTITVFVPPDRTSLVQVVFNGPFKWTIERRILLTKWIGQAWEEVAA